MEMDIDQSRQGIHATTELFKSVETFAVSVINELLNLQSDNLIVLELIQKLKDVAKYANKDLPTLLKPFAPSFTCLIVNLLPQDINLCDTLCGLFQYPTIQFLKAHLEYAVPHAIFQEDNIYIKNLARSLSTTPSELLSFCASSVITCLFMEPDTQLQIQYRQRIERITRNKNTVEKLQTENQTQITSALALELGLPDKKKQAIIALNRMKDKSLDKMSLSTYLAISIIGILDKVSLFIQSKKEHIAARTCPYALQSLQEVMKLIGPENAQHAVHLVKVFHQVADVSGMESDALSLWDCFIKTLDYDGVKTNLLVILQGLIQISCRSDTVIRYSIANTIQGILADQETLDNLPDFPLWPEFDKIRNYVQQSIDMRYKKQLQRALSCLDAQDDTQVLIGIKKMSQLLTHSVDVATYLSRLLCLAQKYANNPRIMYYVAICFGKLGAIDPTTVDLEIYNNKIQIKDDFKSITENQRFICQVLIDCILPAFKAAKEKQVQFVSFSLQVLLKSAGFATVETMKQKRYESVYKLWLQFPSSVQEILAPFLRTSYKISQVDVSVEYPIYLHSTEFSSWVRLWYCTLEKRANGAAKTIFGACLPVVFNGNTKVATYLLPYLVHHVLLSSNTVEVQRIVEEILNVLKTESIDTRALEVVVSITAHCRQSLNQETRANKMSKFLNCIPDKLMAQASFGVKAYPQTLMHIENYIRSNPHSMTDEDILPLLGKTYAQLELKADLEVLLSTHSAHFLRTAKLIFVESLGRWDEARVHYADRIQRYPDDLEACINYLNCFKKAGNFESILYHADLFGRRHPSWVSYMNSFKMDAAWHLNDYTLMKKFSQEPSIDTYENRIASILLAMHEDQGIQTLSHLESAREELVSQLGTQSYRQLYPVIFKLQVLQEMDDALTLQSEEEIEKLAVSWATNLKRVVPQIDYVLELLRVRYAILYNRLPLRCSSDIWLDIAKISRKNGDLSMSLDAIMNAERESGKQFHQERAKWSWAKGMKKEALSLLGVNKGENGNIDDIVLLCSFYLKDRSVLPRSFMDKLMRKGLECKSRPEKAYEQFCRHANLHMEETISNTSSMKPRMKSYFLIIQRGLKALTFGTKYYYATMSRIINCWFKAYHFSQEMISTKLETFSRDVLDSINRHIRNQATTLPPYMYGKFFTRLISHLTIGHKGVVETLAYIIEYVFTAYPQQTIWLLLGPLKSKTVALHEQVKGILQSARNKSRDGLIPEIIKQGLELQKHLDKLSKQQFTSRSSNTLDLRNILNFDKLLEMKDLLLTIPGENSLFPRLPEKAHDLNFQPFPGKPVTIKEILPEITVMKSLQQPKKISVLGSDGKVYQFLCKANDDLRKDARMMEFNYMINSFLKKSPISRQSKLYIRTYAVVPMGDDWGIIEWIQNIIPLKVIASEKLKSKGIDLQQVQQSYRVQRTNALKATPIDLINMFNNVCESCPVVLHEWFSDTFPEPTQWLESRTRYTKTLAVMSMVGHILGLGDRHAENILFDCTNGDTVHVDLNMLFDRGKSLSVPEVVPYRLTRNLVAAMGVIGYEGLFLKACQETLQVLIDNKDALVSVFQTLYNEWGAESKSREAMTKMEERFREATRSNHAKNLAKDAVNPESLAGMFPGWAAFL